MILEFLPKPMEGIPVKLEPVVLAKLHKEFPVNLQLKFIGKSDRVSG